MARLEFEKPPIKHSNEYTKFPDLPDISKITLLPGELKAKESLKSIRSIGEFFASVGKNAAAISKKFIPRDVDKEKAEKVLDTKYFSGLSPTDKEYDGLLKLALTKTRIERQLVRSTIKERKDSLYLTDTERVVLLHSMDIGDQYDKFYWQWRQNVVTSPLSLKLKEIKGQEELKKPEEQNTNILKDYLKNNNAKIPDNDYIYVTFNEDKNGRIQTVPYAKAFPEPITAISKSIDNILEDLIKVEAKDEKEEKERLGLIHYYQAFNRALTCTDTRQLEERYKNLDEVWFEVRGRMQPIHMMESYSDTINIRVDPEYSLAFLDDRHTQLNNQIKETKKITINYLEKKYCDKKTFPPSKKLMENSVIGIYSLIGAGHLSDSGFFGQNVPNRSNIRLEHGVKIFEDFEYMKQSKDNYMKSLSIIFGQNYANNYFDLDKIINTYAAIYVPGHETGHNFLIQKDIRRSLGTEIEQQLEEHKADSIGALSVTQMPDLNVQKLILQTILMRSLQRIKEKNNLSEKPYYNIALTHLKTMYEIGILSENEKKEFIFNDSPEKIKAFYNKTQKILDELAEIYDTLDRNKAQNFINKYYKEEPPFIKNIHAKLGLKPREQTQNHQ